MKAISLLQPWASLVVMGAKMLETRSWATKYRGDLLIHASAALKTDQRKLVASNPFNFYIRHSSDLPLGVILGKVTLVDIRTSEQCMRDFEMNKKNGWANRDEEYLFGDYSPGRFGWVLVNPVRFDKPIECKGSLGLWNYTGFLNECIH